MIRTFTFLLFMSLSSAAFAQIPPGDPYDASKHVNPIITFVLAKDFKPSTYEEAVKQAEITLLGLSKETGTLTGIDMADAGIRNIRDGRSTVKATFYAVVRQTFKLAAGSELVLYSFKPPKVPERPQIMREGPQLGPIFGSRDPKDKRLGPGPAPEELEIRGKRALLFEKEKDEVRTVAWEEDGIMHTATSSLPLKAFFRVLDDLL
jgi:hypothetical protein